MPFFWASLMIRKAVVVDSDSYGGSIRRMLSDLSAIVSSFFLMPHRPDIRLDEQVHELAHPGDLHARDDVAVGDAPLPEREVVGEHRDALEAVDLTSLKALPRGERAVLDQEERDVVARGLQVAREVGELADRAGLLRVARLDQAILCHNHVLSMKSPEGVPFPPGVAHFRQAPRGESRLPHD